MDDVLIDSYDSIEVTFNKYLNFCIIPSVWQDAILKPTPK